jgi:hypothetical protein
MIYSSYQLLVWFVQLLRLISKVSCKNQSHGFGHVAGEDRGKGSVSNIRFGGCSAILQWTPWIHREVRSSSYVHRTPVHGCNLHFFFFWEAGSSLEASSSFVAPFLHLVMLFLTGSWFWEVSSCLFCAIALCFWKRLLSGRHSKKRCNL